MFGISESNIIEQGEAGELFGSEDQSNVRISGNQTVPNLIVDGVDSIEITRESSNRFRLAYGGFTSGRLWLTRDGVRELKQSLLNDQEEIPEWTLSTELTELPDWFPAPESLPSPVICNECGSEVSVTEVVTPWSEDTKNRYCPDCWSSVREDL